MNTLMQKGRPPFNLRTCKDQIARGLPLDLQTYSHKVAAVGEGSPRFTVVDVVVEISLAVKPVQINRRGGGDRFGRNTSILNRKRCAVGSVSTKEG